MGKLNRRREKTHRFGISALVLPAVALTFCLWVPVQLHALQLPVLQVDCQPSITGSASDVCAATEPTLARVAEKRGCDFETKDGLQSCLKGRFPIGSPMEPLSSYLLESRFDRTLNDDGTLYFRRISGGLFFDYRVVVNLETSDGCRISQIDVQ